MPTKSPAKDIKNKRAARRRCFKGGTNFYLRPFPLNLTPTSEKARANFWICGTFTNEQTKL